MVSCFKLKFSIFIVISYYNQIEIKRKKWNWITTTGYYIIGPLADSVEQKNKK